MRASLSTIFRSQSTWLCCLLVLFLSYFTYMHQYTFPPFLFWDENYHIASAQKYIHGTFFMEPHPPLGKLFIALGEVLVSPETNGDSDQFYATDHGKGDLLPEGHSFAGYRLFPTLFAWLTAPLFFLIFVILTRDSLWASLLSFFYVFDNAIIVHSRAAHLESTLHFFIVVMILLFFLLLEWVEKPKHWKVTSLLFGAAFGAVVTTKVNGLIMLLFALGILWYVRKNHKRFWEFTSHCLIGFLVVFVSVWQIHFSLGSTIQPKLSNDGYYQASDRYKEILISGTNWSPLNFPIMLSDSMYYLKHYSKGVPRLDLCKEGENGSPFFLWPFGGRSIRYRWQTPGADGQFMYLYLQSNPAIWLLGLLSVIVATSLLIANFLSPLKDQLERPFLLAIFLGSYISYMIAMSQIGRVMYLYHYMIPLLFTFVLFALCLMEIRQFWKWKVNEIGRTFILFGSCVLIFGFYQFFRPLTYYEPLTKEQFQLRNLFKVWELKCVNCEQDSILTEKTC